MINFGDRKYFYLDEGGDFYQNYSQMRILIKSFRIILGKYKDEWGVL